MPTAIRENIQRIEEQIVRAREKSSQRGEVTLIAVSKTHPAEYIREAYEAGLRHFGENRVQEWEGKRDGLHDLQANWHLVGHLQSNKSARGVKIFHTIDSVDDFALAQRLDHARAELNATEKLRILIEVRVANEASKTGAEISAVRKNCLAKKSRSRRAHVHSTVRGRPRKSPSLLSAPQKTSR
jgi:pyridoxal phosphate enzyme (YggS family)